MSKAKSEYLLLSKKDTWVRPYFKKYKKLLALVLFLGLLTFFCGSALMFTSGFLISKSAGRPWNVLAVYVPIVLTRAFGIGRPVFRYLERLGSHNWVLKMTSDIRLKLYRALESKAAKAKEEFQTGNILGILAEDIEHIQNLYLRSLFPLLIGVLLYLCLLVGFGVFSIPFALLMLVCFGILLFALPLISLAFNRTRISRRKLKRHVLYNQLTDAVLGVGDWQYSGRYQEFFQKYEAAEEEVRKEEAGINKFARWHDNAFQFIFGLIVVAVLLWASTYFGGSQARLNWVAAFVLALFPLTEALSPVSQGVTEYPMYEDSVRRLDSLPKPDEDQDEEYLAQLPAALKQDVTIEFQQVDFQYTDTSKQILSDFSLTIQSGETVALLGKSGTGKTTLSKLLRGDLSPTAGQITIGGVPVSELDRDMSAVIGVLNQAPHLFNTSLLNNVRLGNIHATDEEVMVAIQQAGLQPVIERLPEGANTLVEEGGKRFSGGEQQRIALARILLQDAPVVVIDEPTIGLDPITERALLETVFAVLKNKTVVWITHHLMAIEHADRVVFLENGQIAMDDTPQVLAKTNAHYQMLLSLDNA